MLYVLYIFGVLSTLYLKSYWEQKPGSLFASMKGDFKQELCGGDNITISFLIFIYLLLIFTPFVNLLTFCITSLIYIFNRPIFKLKKSTKNKILKFMYNEEC